MLMPPQVTFRVISHSRELAALVLDRVSWLETFDPGIVSCRVIIDTPYCHRRDGRHVHVTIELTLPDGAPIVVNHEPSLHGAVRDAGTDEHAREPEAASMHRYMHVAIHDAFDAARRRLQDLARRQREERHDYVAG